MPYLSELISKKVRDSADQVVGRLEDVLIGAKTSGYPALQYVVVSAKGGRRFLLPYSLIGNFNEKEITLNVVADKYEFVEEVSDSEWVYLDRDVMDEQIVDVSGARVVRVNDLRLGVYKEKMCVLGIDVSTKGLLRRLGIDSLDWRDWLKVELIDWRHAQPVHGKLKLDTAAKNLNRLHPADLANVIESLNVRAGSNLVTTLDAKDAAKVIEELDPHLQAVLVKYLGPEKMERILEHMPVDEIVDLLQTMTKTDAQVFISFLKNPQVTKVNKLIKYSDDTAGGLMTTDFVRIQPQWTVAEAIEEVKKRSQYLRSVFYVYALDEDGKFMGAVSLRWLLISDPTTPISELLKNFATTSVLIPDMDMEEVMTIMTKYDLYSAVVLGEGKKMLGVVSIDDVMRQLVPKA